AYMKFQEGSAAVTGDVKQAYIVSGYELEYGEELDAYVTDAKVGIYRFASNFLNSSTGGGITLHQNGGIFKVRKLAEHYYEQTIKAIDGSVRVRVSYPANADASPVQYAFTPWAFMSPPFTEADPGYTSQTGYQVGDYVLGAISGNDNSLVYPDGTIPSSSIEIPGSQDYPTGTWRVMGKYSLPQEPA
ncbi:TPA: hypothetical protein LT061_005044, partial [Salmonella enterica subsp. enterica serovar Blitta]|nr:hypothetical protein [Salmonella enterica subsp. enterica serovar Blitta]